MKTEVLSRKELIAELAVLVDPEFAAEADARSTDAQISKLVTGVKDQQDFYAKLDAFMEQAQPTE